MTLGYLTQRQYDILCFIAEHFRKKTHYPTFREIGEAFRLSSTNGIKDHLIALERKGWIVSEYANRRGMYFTKAAREQLGLLFEEELRGMSEDVLRERMESPVNNALMYHRTGKAHSVPRPRLFGIR